MGDDILVETTIREVNWKPSVESEIATNNTVYLLLEKYDNCDGWSSGDEGVILHGVFSSKKKADKFAKTKLEKAIDYYVTTEEYKDYYGIILLEVQVNKFLNESGLLLFSDWTEIECENDYDV